jgi:hypothetical protein
VNKENKTLSDALLVLLNDYEKGNVSSIKFSMDATLVNEKLKELELRNEKLKAENENLKSIIAKELSENDEFGAEFVHVNILREKLINIIEASKEVCNSAEWCANNGIIAREDSELINERVVNYKQALEEIEGEK